MDTVETHIQNNETSIEHTENEVTHRIDAFKRIPHDNPERRVHKKDVLAFIRASHAFKRKIRLQTEKGLYEQYRILDKQLKKLYFIKRRMVELKDQVQKKEDGEEEIEIFVPEDCFKEPGEYIDVIDDLSDVKNGPEDNDGMDDEERRNLEELSVDGDD
jgi:hypothetical protein